MKQKKIHVLKVAPHEHPEKVCLQNTLSELQKAVDGLIEIIDLEDGVCLMCNEEGKIIGLEGNRTVGDDIIVGTFYIVGSGSDGNLTSLSDEQISKYTERFYDPETFTRSNVQEKLGFYFMSPN